ncbi:universal stress protein [Sphingomonas sp. TDK1]|jgi:nucleotide-binding universal stress UspA family protein|uniref:universal stress protein n=1 Tax=Sphingomonas sp. TDK1 TaxID=453247 RepID=UPI0007D9454B|nr:universal stress protein [Sphingomonas sp. TDK1]OAN64885.1 hypothetical protein A7X12_17230 [Sphingomonas sp. TDK1]
MRSILLPLCDPALDRHAISIGTDLADRLDAQVTALLPLTDFASLPVHGHYPYTAGWDEFIEGTQASAERREVEARQAFEAHERESGVPTRLSLRTVYGNEDAVVARAALTHDLVLFARQSTDEDDPLPTSSLLKTTLETAGRPVLVVNGDLIPTFGKAIAVAWNGSVEAAHAVTAALPLLRRAERVVVLTFATSRTQASSAEELLGYLSRHGVTAEAHVNEPELSVGEELVMEVESLSSDLLVMGGYTHSRMRQTLFGGVTHYVLENARLPLLMAR